MFRRGTYEEVGGHERVRHEVAEDVSLAQILCRSGRKLSLHVAFDAFSTRMYQSLREVVGGWSKNLAIGARQSVPTWVSGVVLPFAIFMQIVLWVIPPLLLLAGFLIGMRDSLHLAAAIATGLSFLFWAVSNIRIKVAPLDALFYPFGASMTAFILLRSWRRGRRVEWKGREYDMEPDPGEAAG